MNIKADIDESSPEGRSSRLNRVDMQFPSAPRYEILSESSRAMEGTCAALDSGLRHYLFPGAQVHVLLGGMPVASLAAGWARANLPMKAGTILPWFCNVKPLIAVAFAKLWAGPWEVHDRFDWSIT